jgi:hypothetical protein
MDSVFLGMDMLASNIHARYKSTLSKVDHHRIQTNLNPDFPVEEDDISNQIKQMNQSNYIYYTTTVENITITFISNRNIKFNYCIYLYQNISSVNVIGNNIYVNTY